MNRLETARRTIHDAIESVVPFGDHSEEGPDGGVLTGWVVIAEWQGTDGNRWLSKLSADATANRGLPAWQERGFCNEGSMDNWPAGEDD